MAIVKYTLVRKDNEIESFQDPHGGSRIGKWIARSPKVETDSNGEKWVTLRGGKYHIMGYWHPFRYRLRRSLYLAEHLGIQRIWVEGNPVPYAFDHDTLKSLGLLTSEAIVKLSSARNTMERFFRPRKADWLLIAIVAFATFGIGFAIGGRI